MLYSSTPDAAVFKVSGHTISTPLKTDAYGHLVVPSTGERVDEALKRVDSVSFFRDGEEIGDFF